jgi:L-2,4-diaminobutyric acid acetyltransferase
VPTNDLAPENVAPEDRLRFRRPCPDDGRDLWRIASEVGLDLNSPYAYVLWGAFFAETSAVAVDPADTVVGFVTGFRPPGREDELFLWQIGVDPTARRQGIGARLLDHVTDQAGPRFVEATVNPSNAASAALFRVFGARHGALVAETPLFGAELFPDGHEAEVLFRIGPFDRH